MVNSDGWLHFIGDRYIKNVDDAESYIAKILDNKKYFYSVIELSQSKKPIGILNFLRRDNQDHPDFGFALLPEFEKKGYAFEAGREYLDKLIESKMYQQIIAITKPDNKNSIGLLTRLGFTFQHNCQDGDNSLFLYSINV